LKRVLAALLWFYAGWYAGAAIAFTLALPDLLGPVLGVAAAVLVAGDPRGIFWSRNSSTPRVSAVGTRSRKKRAAGTA